MDRLIATFAALVLVFFMATLALFLILVETADAATIDATLSSSDSTTPGAGTTFTLAYTPSLTPDAYTGARSTLWVNGKLIASTNYSFNAAKGSVSFDLALSEASTQGIKVLLDVIYYKFGALSGGNIACGTLASCTLFFAPHLALTPVQVDADSISAGLSVFVEPPAERSDFSSVALLQEISPVPLGGSLPLLASALALIGLAARHRGRTNRASA
jgi:hypothetical protein